MEDRSYGHIFVAFLLISTISFVQTTKAENTDSKILNAPTDTDILKRLYYEDAVAHNAADVDGCANTTEGAVFIPDVSPLISGRSAIRNFCQSLLAEYKFDINVTIDQVVVQDQWAVVRGTWKGTVAPIGGGMRQSFQNTAINFYTLQENREWKLARAVWYNNGILSN